jgi:flagellar biosynthesis anti-sigma factor FlgM
MRIDISQTSDNSVELEKSSKSQQPTATPDSSSIVDRASLQSDTTTVSALVQKAMAVPDVRQERVDQLRQQIQSGTYQHDPASTATAMRENGI